tara:strand:+ start:288 stop:479 length:192 start_codon:yes stop_codon:yes gene_type:complete
MFENEVIVDLNVYGLANGSNDGLCTSIAAKVTNLSDPPFVSSSLPLYWSYLSHAMVAVDVRLQ